MFEFLYKPQNDISYDFIAVMYFIAVIIGTVLYALDSVWAIEQVKGFWIIFVPFFPATLWVIYMRLQKNKELATVKKLD
jgi:F0F1-type ATP synthase assembly protein I